MKQPRAGAREHGARRRQRVSGQRERRSGYRFAEVLTHTGAKRTQLIHWTHVGLIKAHVQDTGGTGHHRQFGFPNLVEARVAVVLAGYGLSVTAMDFILGQVGRRLEWMRTSTARDQVLWIAGPIKEPDVLWFGSMREFIQEFQRPYGRHARAGVIISLGGLVEDLEAATRDHL